MKNCEIQVLGEEVLEQINKVKSMGGKLTLWNVPKMGLNKT